jgi:hypothetical protein
MDSAKSNKAVEGKSGRCREDIQILFKEVYAGTDIRAYDR